MARRHYCPHCGSRKGSFFTDQPKMTWVDLLKILVSARRPLTLKELCEASGLSRGNCWTRMDRMIQAGMAQKSETKRGVMYEPTQQGVRLVSK